MEDKKQKAALLIDRYIAGKCTSSELLLVEKLYMKQALNKQLKDEDLDMLQIKKESWLKIEMAIHKPVRRFKLWLRLAVAASLLLCLSIGLYFFNQQKAVENMPVANLVVPGGNKATLTYNGRTIVLNSSKNGIIVAASAVIYSDGTKLEGVAKDVGNQELLTLNTPRGGQYQVLLPDGTKVWLNAASSLKYPAKFDGSKRQIELIGEAYFEVTKSGVPFVVKTSGQEVTVLGTEFNVSAYPDETETKTTLINGSVHLRINNNSSVMLRPNQLGIFKNNSLKVEDVDVDHEIAWKNGYFSFNNTPVREVMRQIGRWYNVETQYVGDVDHVTFGGLYSKTKDFHELLKGLEAIGLVRFKVEGRRVIVMK